jgi:hypothetical protein
VIPWLRTGRAGSEVAQCHDPIRLGISRGPLVRVDIAESELFAVEGGESVDISG